jgi:hypothetical protein
MIDAKMKRSIQSVSKSLNKFAISIFDGHPQEILIRLKNTSYHCEENFLYFFL